MTADSGDKMERGGHIAPCSHVLLWSFPHTVRLQRGSEQMYCSHTQTCAHIQASQCTFPDKSYMVHKSMCYVGVGVKHAWVPACKDDTFGDFLGAPVIKNPPCNAGDTAGSRGQGAKIPQVSGRLSPRATTTEPARSRASTLQLENQKSPPDTVKIPHAITKTRGSQTDAC